MWENAYLYVVIHPIAFLATVKRTPREWLADRPSIMRIDGMMGCTHHVAQATHMLGA